MIKFFRKIRQNLLMENKTGKYFKYAIGEIFLVVIGILVALSINNWNENRKSDIELNNYLELMVEELQQDISFYKILITGNNDKLKYLISLSKGNFENLNLENAQDIIAYNYGIRNFGSAYYTLKENGKIIGINNKKLRDLMIFYYDDLTASYNQTTDWHRNFVVANIENYTTEHLPLDIDGNTKPSVVIKEMQNNKLLSIVNYQIDNFRVYNKLATGNIKTVEELILNLTMKLIK